MKIKPKILIVLLSTFYFLLSGVVFASETNGAIVSGSNNGYAWSNQAGWINFGCSGCGISITDAGVMGYAWNSNYGWINMNPSNGGVTIAANGALSGYAWSSGLGWINFAGVTINSSGKFVGTASGVNIGTLTFDCANCSVVTDYRPQNFRAVVAPPASSGGGGGGGGGGGIIFQLNPSLISTQTSLLEMPVRPPGEGIETPGEGALSAEITSPVVSKVDSIDSPQAELEENPPLFDIEVGPGPSQSKKTKAFIILAALIVAAGGAIFYFRKKKNQQ